MDKEFSLTTRVSFKDIHYDGKVVAGAHVLELFGDAITGLALINDNDEGLLSKWENVNFYQKVNPGDFLKVYARIVNSSRLKRNVEVNAWRVTGLKEYNGNNDLVADAKGTFVIPFVKAKGV